MQFKNFIGIDVSKLQLDLSLIIANQESTYLGNCSNVALKVESFLKKLLKTKKLTKEETLICAEFTGIYSKPLEVAASKLGIGLWMENPRTIKLSVGFNRGKSDSVDSSRIADYSKRFADRVRLHQLKSVNHVELETLSHARESLIQVQNQLAVQIKEAEKFDPKKAEILKQSYSVILDSTKLKLKEVNKQIDIKIKENEQVKRSIELITSIPGIGRETALSMVLITRNFTIFENAGQMACFAGVAPFIHESGTSIKGRTRISPYARKDLKKLLHMAALCTIRYNEDLKKYFVRKVKEGKNKMSVINALRNKLIQRIFAVIKRGTPYTQEYCRGFSVSTENLNLVVAS